jgi:hypothetical protein
MALDLLQLVRQTVSPLKPMGVSGKIATNFWRGGKFLAPAGTAVRSSPPPLPRLDPRIASKGMRLTGISSTADTPFHMQPEAEFKSRTPDLR